MRISYTSKLHKDLYRKVNFSSAGSILSCWDQFVKIYPQFSNYRESWLDSRYGELKPLDLQLPWVCYDAIEWLQSNLTSDMFVFEWGMGGSSLFLADRCAKVYSVEHDPQWYDQANSYISSAFARFPKWLSRFFMGQRRCELVLREPVKSDVRVGYESGLPVWSGYSFEQYVTEIHRFDTSFFDLVLVDGRARMACMREAAKYVKPGGSLMLDNSDYQRYQDELSVLESTVLRGWKLTSFLSPGPSSKCIGWETRLYTRPIN